MQTYTEIRRGNQIIRGMLYRPDGASSDSPMPIVLVCHGFSVGRWGTLFIHKRLAKQLCEEGIATLTFDFMGSGESDGEFCEMSVLTEVEDLLAVLDHVRRLDFADRGKIAFHGMSQGGLVACLAAGREPKAVRAVSLWAPAFAIPDMCAEGTFLDMPLDEIEETGYVDYHGEKVGAVYVRDALRINVREDVKSYRGPIQIVHGTADETVPYVCSERFREMFGEQCVLRAVEGANHDFETLSANRQRLDHAVAFLKRELS